MTQYLPARTVVVCSGCKLELILNIVACDATQLYDKSHYRNVGFPQITYHYYAPDAVQLAECSNCQHSLRDSIDDTFAAHSVMQDSSGETPDYCYSHQYRTYVGFTDIYSYCIICDKKG